jgi:phenylacetate-CoA ligase
MRTSIVSNFFYFAATTLSGQPVRHLLPEYVSRDRQSTSTLLAFQGAQLQFLLRHASTSTDRYSLILGSEFEGPSSVHPDLRGIPLLSKDTLREAPGSLISRDVKGLIERKTTSGSTGHPVTVWKDRIALARERAATLRAYQWAGIPTAAPQALLWGLPLTFGGRMYAGLKDLVANRLRLPMFGVTERELDRYYQRILRFRPLYLYGYASAIETFVRFVESNGNRLPDCVQAIITTSEMLDPETRRYLVGTTGLSVFNEYGCGEVGSIAHDCEFGHLHIMADNLILECLPMPDLPSGLGELVVTDLFNRAMPLIRYRLGDLGSLSPSACPCGRPYPVLERIVGRAYDMIEDTSGRKYHPEAVLYAFEHLKRSGISLPPFQAVQDAPGQLNVRFQTSTQLSSDVAERIKAQLVETFQHKMDIRIVLTSQLEREESGKFRVVKRTGSALH